MVEPAAGDAPADLTLVTMAFEAEDTERLLVILAKYIVLSRGHHGCRNIDLCASMTNPGRIVVVEKWASPTDQRAHFDSPEMVEMAKACRDVLRAPPAVDLLTALSAHDLR